MLDYDVVPAPAGEAAAACLVLHGLGDSMEGWRPVAPAILPPEVTTVLVNAPDPYLGGYAWFPIPGFGDAATTQADMDAGIRRSRRLLRATIDRVLVELGLPSQRLLLVGFSQGCCMVLDAALRDPRLFAGVVGISGFVSDLGDLPEHLSPAATSQSVLQTHGRYDQVIPLEWAEACHEALVSWGLVADFRIYAKDHGVDPVEELPELRAWIEGRVRAAAGTEA